MFRIILLYPFAVLYGLITAIRNFGYDQGWFKSARFDVPTIGVGNLSVGGSGKTPMIEYLIRLTKDDKQTVTLSRGYKRKSKGFLLAERHTSVEAIGDEPSQFLFKYGNQIHVAVGEKRAAAIPEIIKALPATEVILLDDIYQHRSVKPDCMILLTTYQQPFYRDYMLPSGSLRESRTNARRADVIIVTKCPAQLDQQQKLIITKRIREYADTAKVFFTSIAYQSPIVILGDTPSEQVREVVLVSGLANADLFEQYVASQYKLIRHCRFRDHHDYTAEDVKKIVGEARQCAPQAVVLTTEKDVMKLKSMDWEGLSLAYIPIETVFHEHEAQFQDIILSTV